MTITSEDNIEGGFVGDGTTNSVDTPPFQKNADIRAVQITDATGAETVLVLDTNYTLSGAGDPDGGTLTPLAARAVGTTLYVTVDPAKTQQAVNPGREATEDALDKLTQIVQQMQLQLDRAFKLPEADRLAGSVNTTRKNDGPTINASRAYDPVADFGDFVLLDVDSNAVELTLPDATSASSKKAPGFLIRINSNANLASIVPAVSGQLRSKNNFIGHNDAADAVYIGLAQVEQRSSWVYVYQRNSFWHVIGQLRQNSDDDLRQGAGTGSGGDMLASVYDPGGVIGNAFARANHSGTQDISTISGLQSALDAKVDDTQIGTASGNLAVLDGDGEFPASLLNKAPTGGSSLRQFNDQAGASYQLQASDATPTIKIVRMTRGSANTVTVPSNATEAMSVGSQVDLVQFGAGTTTITGASGVTINGASAGSADVTAQYNGVSLVKVATDEWTAFGAVGTFV